MTWDDVRKYFPNTWVVVEGLRFRTEGDTRIFEDMAILQCCEDGAKAQAACNDLQKQFNERLLIMFHTSRNMVEFTVTYRFGSRSSMRYEDSTSRKPAFHLSDADIPKSETGA